MQMLDSFASRSKLFNGNTRLREKVRCARRKWESVKDHDWITKLIFFGYTAVLTLAGVFLQIHQVSFYYCAWFYTLGAACVVAGIMSRTLQDMSQKEKAVRDASRIISTIARQGNSVQS